MRRKGSVSRQNTAGCLGTWRTYCSEIVFDKVKCVTDNLELYHAMCVTHLMVYTPLLVTVIVFHI